MKVGRTTRNRTDHLTLALTTVSIQEVPMKGLVAWWLGVPVIVIIILYLTGIF